MKIIARGCAPFLLACLFLAGCGGGSPNPSASSTAGAKPVELTTQNYAIEVEQSKGAVLVDFWAPWCGPCQMISPIVEEVAGEMAGKLTIKKLNIDNASDIAKRLNIRSIPCLILFVNGKEIGRKIGFAEKPDLKKWLETKIP